MGVAVHVFPIKLALAMLLSYHKTCWMDVIYFVATLIPAFILLWQTQIKQISKTFDSKETCYKLISFVTFSDMRRKDRLKVIQGTAIARKP
jgi:hypothetical protein